MSVIVHQPFVTRRSSSPNQFVPVIVSPLPCSSELVRHALLFAYYFFFKKLISFNGSLDKCHTSIFNDCEMVTKLQFALHYSLWVNVIWAIAVGDAHVFPGFLKPVLTQLSFQSHRLLFSHASAEVRDGNMPERKFASTGYRTHNQQVMCHPGG